MPGHVDVAAKMFLMIIQGSDACAFFRRQQILDDRVSMVVQIRCKGVPVISGGTRPGCLASCNTQRILLVHLSLPVCRSGGRMHPVPCFQTCSARGFPALPRQARAEAPKVSPSVDARSSEASCGGTEG